MSRIALNKDKRVKRSSQLSLPPQLSSGDAILLHKIIVLQVGDLPLEIGDQDGLILVLPSQFCKEFLPGLVFHGDHIFLDVGHVQSVWSLTLSRTVLGANVNINIHMNCLDCDITM